MNKLIKSKNWKKLEDNFVFVANHEESIKTKNIVEKIKFEGMFTFHFNKYLRINGYKNLNFIFQILDVSSVMSTAIKSQIL